MTDDRTVAVIVHQTAKATRRHFMQRYALVPRLNAPEQILVTIPGMARSWTISRRNRGVQRLLLPVDESLRALDALRYIIEDVGHLVVSVHL
jgi:hypothetical protein